MSTSKTAPRPAARVATVAAAAGPDPGGNGAITDRRAGAPDPRPEGAPERRSGFDRRRGPGKRRTDYRRAAEEGHMNEEQLAFLLAMEEYKRVNHRPFPSLTETLDVLLYLGYRKVAGVGEFKLCKGRQGESEDGVEAE